jgi:fructokinase
MAKKAGAIIAYDPNYRAPLWPSEDAAIAQMRSVLPLVDCVKISDEEISLITGAENYEKAADALLAQGAACAVITLGKNGAYTATRLASAQIPAPPAPVVDTTGAGDAFWGGFLYQLLQHKTPAAALSNAQLKASVTFANAVATLCVQKRGAIPAMPTLEETERFLRSLA